ncbi:hypothetical protein M2175_003902 [Bradyrhizobium elkanii]|uniref:hypothetical protein n=1 Tax=Bradyrhizobium TaxID=374 RepID=UPI00216A3473|nr:MULTISPECIES: hypothetical protein [Bradyrhizobium]MCS3928871.1 hypothetical protein [Bradyrhizobium elkanii]MCS3969425.1 hypothetical protein [Bradyrhizobium japonicum]
MVAGFDRADIDTSRSRNCGALDAPAAAARTHIGVGETIGKQGMIWVRVRSPEKEDEAQESLMHGGQAVHIHEIELAKRLEELPLHSLRPDPWLGDERLGRP